jgi:hypothetical protein
VPPFGTVKGVPNERLAKLAAILLVVVVRFFDPSVPTSAFMASA